MSERRHDFEEGPTVDFGGWASRLLQAAQGGAPAIRTLLSSDVELRVQLGKSSETARGGTIVSEWLAGRFALARRPDVTPMSIQGNKVTARLDLGGGSSPGASWLL